MEKLHSFSPTELASLLCGDQAPEWSRDDILTYTEPKLGYSKERLVLIFYSEYNKVPMFNLSSHIMCVLFLKYFSL